VRILLSNDDGYFAPGIEILASRLSPFGKVVVVAPERDHSNAANALTTNRPLIVERAANGFYFINGTPTDCVHVALTGLLEDRPDLVVTGINLGPNLGDDAVHAGTVAAALEAALFGVPAIAISLMGTAHTHLATAAEVAARLVRRFADRQMRDLRLVNVNVPDLSLKELRGLRVTRLGQRHRARRSLRTKTPNAERAFWIGPPRGRYDNGPGTDFHAIAARCVSVTPLRLDLSDERAARSASARRMAL
jgi:5'-nucleotidase